MKIKVTEDKVNSELSRLMKKELLKIDCKIEMEIVIEFESDGLIDLVLITKDFHNKLEPDRQELSWNILEKNLPKNLISKIAGIKTISKIPNSINAYIEKVNNSICIKKVEVVYDYFWATEDAEEFKGKNYNSEKELIEDISKSKNVPSEWIEIKK